MIRALLVDAAGTLLRPAEPVPRTYARVARRHGVEVSEEEVRAGFRRAFAHPRPQLRYVGDGRPFWREVVAEATGSADPDLFEDLYRGFAHPEAWTLAEGALVAFDRLRARGHRVALVSDWDDRLRPLLGALGVLGHLDATAISCEVGAEKPDPALFLAACSQLGVPPHHAVHVGDDPDRDVAGARAAGCRAWLWGVDVSSFAEAASRVLAWDDGA